MTAQVFGFPEKEGIAWHHLAPYVRQAALDRSGSSGIADRVVDVIAAAYKRSVPAKISFRKDSVEAMQEDVAEALQQIVGAMVAELVAIATDAEMLAADHDSHTHRDR